MASTPLTLAALATSAVPGLTVTAAREHTGGGDGAFASAVLAGDDRRVIVRVPVTPAAEVRQSGELLGQAALAEGARESLPFAVPRALGMTRAGDSRAVVSTFLDGDRIASDRLDADALLLESIAESIAAIHALPSTPVLQGGLPLRSAEEVRQQAGRLVQRAAETRVLPDTVHRRWREALASDALWSFDPTVVHGSLSVDQLLVSEDRVVGVLGWSELAVGDPAIDLAWLFASGDGVFEAVLTRYEKLRELGASPEFASRARFYHELEVARWLLHGTETHDPAVVDDAVAMLDRLVDRLSLIGGPVPVRAVMSEPEVERMLDEVPEVGFDPRSETAEYEALDEDRAFDSSDDED